MASISTKTMACPVCGESIPLTVDTMEAWGSQIACEEYADCPKGHYFFEWAYGSYREAIGEEQFIWSDKETPEQAAARKTAFADAIRRARLQPTKP